MHLPLEMGTKRVFPFYLTSSLRLSDPMAHAAQGAADPVLTANPKNSQPGSPRSASVHQQRSLLRGVPGGGQCQGAGSRQFPGSPPRSPGIQPAPAPAPAAAAQAACRAAPAAELAGGGAVLALRDVGLQLAGLHARAAGVLRRDAGWPAWKGPLESALPATRSPCCSLVRHDLAPRRRSPTPTGVDVRRRTCVRWRPIYSSVGGHSFQRAQPLPSAWGGSHHLFPMFFLATWPVLQVPLPQVLPLRIPPLNLEFSDMTERFDSRCSIGKPLATWAPGHLRCGWCG